MSTNSVGLSQAHYILREEGTQLVSLSPDDLWRSYSLDNAVLTGVKEHLVQTRWLSEQGKWEGVDENQFAALSEDDSEIRSLAFFSRLFNMVLEYLRHRGHGSPVKRMIYASSVRSESTRAISHQPDAFLHLNTGASPRPGKFKWRDLVCPFEYELDDRAPRNNDTSVLRSIHHIMRYDPRRTFSFGVTTRVTVLRIWLLCRAAPITFTPFDWVEEPDSLLKLIIMLVTSDETNLGFDKSIVRIGNKSNFDLEFTIQDTVYHTSKLLYDLGADAATGRGTRVFEVVDQKSKEVRVIKDCWIENRPGKQLEHDIVAGIKRDIEARIEHGTGNDEDFHKHFVDTCGYKKTDGFGGLDGICKLLKTRTFVKHGFEPELLVPTAEAPKLYHHPAKDKIADQDHLVLPTEGERDPLTPPHPRFRYQVVYSEKGKSLFEVTSFSDAFGYLVQAADALHYLHRVGWVHRDFTPGNIIVVGTTAKISDFEFAIQQETGQLEEQTKLMGASSPVMGDTCVGALHFVSIEVETGQYMFRPIPQPGLEEDSNTDDIEDAIQLAVHQDKRTFLHNPLHDYESIWWIAVWLVFCCKSHGVADGVMKRARDEVYKNRVVTFLGGGFDEICDRLPAVLQPLGEVLMVMKNALIRAYTSFEDSFDGSGMLLVFSKLRECFLLLENLAQSLTVKSPIQNRKLNMEGVEQFDAVHSVRILFEITGGLASDKM